MNKILATKIQTWFSGAMETINDQVETELKRHSLKRSDGQLTTDIIDGNKTNFSVTLSLVTKKKTNKLLSIEFNETGFNMYGHADKHNIEIIGTMPAVLKKV